MYYKCQNGFILLSFYVIYIITVVSGYSEGHISSIKFESKVKPFDLKNIENLIVFGDSFSQVSTDLDDMTYTGENRSLGENWPLILTKKYNLNLWNFAVSGAVIDNTIKMSKGKEFGDRWNGDNTLFAFWFGTNDILYINRTIYENGLDETYELMVDILSSKLDEIYNTGARNLLFINTASLDKFPSFRKIDKDTVLKNCEVFNNRLIKNTNDFYNGHNDTNVFIYDAYNEYNFIIENFKKYDFISPYDSFVNISFLGIDGFIWTDGLHPSRKTHKIMTNDLELLINKNIKNISSASRNKKVTVIHHLISISVILYLLF
ncbi:carbohydrate esterase family 16 protein [Piromyces sp. E2]|nr:carbohydrate esterase family 16 protein [Piromyces sp. E2]|eukprot:OUM61934.1 carbohydrate esterase family 16 protein [Piromyces sp. E2]